MAGEDLAPVESRDTRSKWGGKMRIAAFGDVHGNLVALTAVLNDIATSGVDASVCLGDYAYKGPAPGDCVQVIRGLGVPCVHGNTELALLREAGRLPDTRQLSEDEIPLAHWHVSRFSTADLDFLVGLPRVHRINDGQQTLLFTHAHPDEVERAVMPGDPTQAVDERLAGLGCNWLIMGHTHVPYLFRSSGVRLVNAGSVGFPLDGNPRSSYVIIDTDSGIVEFRRVAYNIDAAVALAEARDFCFDPAWYGETLRSTSPAIHGHPVLSGRR